MSTIAPWLLLLHVLAALWLAAGAFGGAVVRAMNRRATEPAARVQGLRIAWRMVQVFALPGGLLVALIGFAIVHPLGYSFRPVWVHGSIALWLYSYAVAVLYLAPWLKKTLAAAEASLAAGAPSVELQRLTAMKAPRILADVNALVLVVIVLLMVIKPF